MSFCPKTCHKIYDLKTYIKSMLILDDESMTKNVETCQNFWSSEYWSGIEFCPERDGWLGMLVVQSGSRLCHVTISLALVGEGEGTERGGTRDMQWLRTVGPHDVVVRYPTVSKGVNHLSMSKQFPTRRHCVHCGLRISRTPDRQVSPSNDIQGG